MAGNRNNLPRFFFLWVILATVVILAIFAPSILRSYIHDSPMSLKGHWYEADAVISFVVVGVLFGFLIVRAVFRKLSGAPVTQDFDDPDDPANHLLRYDVAAGRYLASQGQEGQTEVEVIPAAAAPATNTSAPPGSWSLELIQALDWKRFRALCAGFYEAKGYQSKAGHVRSDGGVELFLYRKGQSGGAVFGVVHCQNWNWKWISTELIEALEAARQESGAALAVFITSTHYADEARAFAESKKIELITGDKLVALLNALPESTRKQLFDKVTVGDYATPTCPHCDVKMVPKTGHGDESAGKVWSCPNYPHCSETFRLMEA